MLTLLLANMTSHSAPRDTRVPSPLLTGRANLMVPGGFNDPLGDINTPRTSNTEGTFFTLFSCPSCHQGAGCFTIAAAAAAAELYTTIARNRVTVVNYYIYDPVLSRLARW